MDIKIVDCGNDRDLNDISGLSFFNYLQSPLYADAIDDAHGKIFRRFSCWCEDRLVGYVQARVYDFFPRLKIAVISRAILCHQKLSTSKGQHDAEAIIRALFEYLQKDGFFLVCYSNSFSPQTKKQEKLRLRIKVPSIVRAPWASSYLFLGQGREKLSSGLKSKWRNMLRRSYKHGVVVSVVDDRAGLDRFIERYEWFKKHRGFSGVSNAILRHLLFPKRATLNNRLIVYQASDAGGMIISYVAVFKSFDTSTYFIAINEGAQKLNANYALLWRAIMDSEARGEVYFDLGGISDKTPKGIKHFKDGLGGTSYSDIPYYIELLCLRRLLKFLYGVIPIVKRIP